MRNVKIGLLALAVIGLTFPAQAYLGRVVLPACGGGGDVLDPADGQHISMYMNHSTDPNSFMYYIDDASAVFGCAAWNAGGAFDCNFLNFPVPPASNATVWAIATKWDDPGAMTTHNGMVMVDGTCTNENAMDANIMQVLTPLGATPGAFDADGDTSYTAGELTSGMDVRFNGLAEYGLPVNICQTGSPLSGKPTCENDGLLPLERAIVGYNVYRIQMDPASSTPMHYLYGPDGTAGTADDGFVGFVPYAVLNPDDPTQPVAGSDPTPGDAFGIEGVDGGTGNALEDTIILIFSDGPRTGFTGVDASYSYVFQPVIQGNANQDVDSDGISDLDLDGDTSPEFISPQGSGAGLGLTAHDSTGTAHILISTDMPCDGTAPTPASDALTFQANFNTKSKSFDIQFVSALESDVAGFNIYRALNVDDPTAFRRVNRQLIPAKGTALSTYVYSDSVNLRQRSGSVFYKVEAVSPDGSTMMYGPYRVDFVSAHRSRRLR
jgi:hypothetical protein